MSRYYVYKDGAVQGPFGVSEIRDFGNFSGDLQVCLEGAELWKPASAFKDFGLLQPQGDGDDTSTEISQWPWLVSPVGKGLVAALLILGTALVIRSRIESN